MGDSRADNYYSPDEPRSFRATSFFHAKTQAQGLMNQRTRAAGVEALERIQESLPNGFHDALLEGWSFDAGARELTIGLAVDVSDAESGELRASYRSGVLTLIGLVAVQVDKVELAKLPGSRHPVEVGSGPDRVHSSFGSGSPRDAFLGWIYLRETDAFIRFSATTAEWTWRTEP